MHNIFHNFEIASSGEINISDFIVCLPFKDKSLFDFLELKNAWAQILGMERSTML